MARYYLQFSKEGYAVYTSHLDMQRFFKRAFARAGVGLAFSNGFNPHPKMSFAQPLSLGYSSRGEYLEFQTADQWQDTEIKSRLQEVMPEGISILTVRQLPEQGKSLASMCTAASYKIFLRWDPQEMGNGDRSVSATFIVGGGGKIPGFAESIADKMDIPRERVALRGEEVLKSVIFEQKDIVKDPLLVAPHSFYWAFFSA